MDKGLKAMHDLLLEHAPDGVAHTPCLLCDESVVTEQPGRGEMAEKSYTQEDLEAQVAAAVAKATGPLEAQLNELKASKDQQEGQQAQTEAIAAKDTEIAELQSKLDTAVLEASKSAEDKTAIEAFWTKAVEDAEQAQALETRKGERITKLKEVVSFPETYLDENADRFAAMSDEDFAARLDEYAQVASKTEGDEKDKKVETEGKPAATALKASRQTQSTASAVAGLSALREARVNTHAFRA
jgi:hypothetical protein